MESPVSRITTVVFAMILCLAVSALNVNSSENLKNKSLDWNEAGFDRGEQDGCERSGIVLKEAIQWKKAGIRCYKGKAWKRWGYTVEEAIQLNAANVRNEGQKWQNDGVPFEEIMQWVEIGITRSYDATKWKKDGFTIKDVAYWFDRGIKTPSAAQQELEKEILSPWEEAGIAAYYAKQWIGKGVALEEAVSWTKQRVNADDLDDWQKAGFSQEEIRQWLAAKIKSPSYAKKYTADDIQSDEALEWFLVGVKSRDQIVSYKDSGFIPSEWSEWHEDRSDFRGGSWIDWKETGLSFDDAMEWSDAGYSPDEAESYTEKHWTIKDVKEKLTNAYSSFGMDYEIGKKQVLYPVKRGAGQVGMNLGDLFYNLNKAGKKPLYKSKANSLSMDGLKSRITIFFSLAGKDALLVTKIKTGNIMTGKIFTGDAASRILLLELQAVDIM